MGGADFPYEDFDHLSRDEKFLRKLRFTVESNLENEHFGVRSLAEAMALSRIQLFRRIRRLTGKNVSQYIREIRLEKAMELLKKDVATVSEIAYRVGFSSPAYFNRCFHTFYGYPPGELVQKQKMDRGIYQVDQISKEENPIILKAPVTKKYLFNGKSYFWFIIAGILSVSLVLLLIWYLPVIRQAQNLLKSEPNVISANEKSIAVLPFRNESPDADNEYFCNSMQDEILNHLQKIADLSVRSMTSVEQYRDTNKDIRTIGRELNAAYILEGSVWKLGEQFRMSAQLIDTRTDDHLWGETYDLLYSDTLFVIPTHIAKRIAASLQAILTPLEERRIAQRYTDNINSYDYAIRGNQEMSNFWKYSDRKHLETALDLYNISLELDPENLYALAGKGNVYLYKQQPDSTIFYCERAIELNPTIPDAYHVLAAYYARREEYDSAILFYLKTIDLAPNEAMAHTQLGQIYITQKKDVINGMRHLNKSLELNVYGQPYIFYWVGMCLLHIGDYERADRYFRKEIAMNLNCLTIEHYSWCLAVLKKQQEAYLFLDTICALVDCERICIREQWYQSYCRKDYDRAENYLMEYSEKGYELEVHWKIVLADIYLRTSREEKAGPVLKECRTFFENSLEWWGETWYNTFNLSHIYAMQGEKKKGLEYLSKAVDIGMLGGWQDLLEINTVYENLWGEPEFKELVEHSKTERAALRARIREMEERGEINL